MAASQLQEDRKLARQVAAGRRGAFDAFFREYFPRLFRFALARVGNDEALAEEIVQRTMCIVVRKMGSYRGEALLFTWLCQICRNETSAVYRERGLPAARHVPLEDRPEVQAALESMTVDGDDPERQQGAADIARFVRVTLEYLPARYSAALEMKYMQGFSVAEIAASLGLSDKAAESVLTRAREAFREGFRTLHALEPDGLLD